MANAVIDIEPWQGWFHGCAQPVRDVVTKWQRLWLAECKPRISPIVAEHIHYVHQHDDVIKWKHFPRYWPFVRIIHRSVTRSFDVFFYLRLDKRLSKQSWGWWFETLPRPLWRHFTETCIHMQKYGIPRIFRQSLSIHLGPVSLRLMTSHFKDIITHTQK